MPSPVSPGQGSCAHDLEDVFPSIPDDLQISDALPSLDVVADAANLPVYDAEGIPRPFGTLFAGDEVVNQRQLFIFVRFFYCGACQMYLRGLTKAFTPDVYFTLPVPTSIIVIGCGRPELINQYKAATNCPWPIYADPSRKLYKKFGMSFALTAGPRPAYCGDINIVEQALGQVVQQVHAGPKKALKGGQPFQIGGEFLFEDGEVIWCHRMRNFRDHSEIDIIKQILEIDADEDEYDVPILETARVMSTLSICSPRQLDIVYGDGPFSPTRRSPAPEIDEDVAKAIEAMRFVPRRPSTSQWHGPRRNSPPAPPLSPLIEQHSPVSSVHPDIIDPEKDPEFLHPTDISTTPSLESLSRSSDDSDDSDDSIGESFLDMDSDSEASTPTFGPAVPPKDKEYGLPGGKIPKLDLAWADNQSDDGNALRDCAELILLWQREI